MQITATPVSMAIEDARKKGIEKGGFFGRLAVKKPMSKIELHYFPFLLIDFRYESMPGLFSRKKKTAGQTGSKINTISILCDASTLGTALVEKKPPRVVANAPEDSVQEARYSEQQMEKAAYKMAFRLLRKHVFGGQQMATHQVTQLYRPYYVAFYGEKVIGEKVRYMPFPADGYQTNRTT